MHFNLWTSLAHKTLNQGAQEMEPSQCRVILPQKQFNSLDPELLGFYFNSNFELISCCILLVYTAATFGLVILTDSFESSPYELLFFLVSQRLVIMCFFHAFFWQFQRLFWNGGLIKKCGFQFESHGWKAFAHHSEYWFKYAWRSTVKYREYKTWFIFPWVSRGPNFLTQITSSDVEIFTDKTAFQTVASSTKLDGRSFLESF